jgi:hypothetical protein
MKLHAKARFARLWIMLLFTSLSMVSVSAVSFAVPIGKLYQGGIVFYVDESHQHGLVVARRDLPGIYEWQGAKEACERFVDGGFSDWYLPSKWQLNELYKSKRVVGGEQKIYWSSSVDDAGLGWFQTFAYEGYQNAISKNVDLQVRAVRAF